MLFNLSCIILLYIIPTAIVFCKMYLLTVLLRAFIDQKIVIIVIIHIMNIYSIKNK